MPLPGSGLIAITNIVTEFGGLAPHGLNEYYRGGAYVPNHSNTAGIPTSGTIGFAHFYAASDTFSFAETITVSMAAYNLRTRLLAAGWDGVAKVDALINIQTGVFITSNPLNTWAWRIGGSLPSGSIVRLYNYGFIIGSGGRGATGAGVDANNQVILSSANNPTSALLADWFVTIYNYGYIASGGGYGGGGSSRYSPYTPAYINPDPKGQSYPEQLGARVGGGGGGNGAGSPFYGASNGGYAAPGTGIVAANGQQGAVGSNTQSGAGGAGGSAQGVVGGTGGQGGALGGSGYIGGVGSGGVQLSNTFGGGPQYAYYFGGNISWAVYGNVIGLTA